jgi:hypothetical protein
MKEPISIVVSQGADGLKVHSVGLSCGEARATFDRLCVSHPLDLTEVWLFEKLKARKSRRFTSRQNVVTPVYIPPPPEKVITKPIAKLAAKIIRRGR